MKFRLITSKSYLSSLSLFIGNTRRPSWCSSRTPLLWGTGRTWTLGGKNLLVRFIITIASSALIHLAQNWREDLMHFLSVSKYEFNSWFRTNSLAANMLRNSMKCPIFYWRSWFNKLIHSVWTINKVLIAVNSVRYHNLSKAHYSKFLENL